MIWGSGGDAESQLRPAAASSSPFPSSNTMSPLPVAVQSEKGIFVSLSQLHKLVDDAQALGRRVLGEARPSPARQFADVDVAVPVDGDAVRRGELAGSEAGMHLAEPGQHHALGRMDADARADIGPILVDL